jgi:hypothetical protein
VGLRVVKRADVRQDEQRLHEQHDAQRDGEERNAREPAFVAGALR